MSSSAVPGKGPLYFSALTTHGMMWGVSMCLVPVVLWGIYLFGLDAVFPLVAAIAGACLTEFALTLRNDNSTLQDGSAVLTGLLLGLSMPPGVPVFIPFLAAAFAIAVIKLTFGGLGSNWMNPALGGRVFAQISWPQEMSRWAAPLGFPEGLSGATPLRIVRDTVEAGSGGAGPIAALRASGYPTSALDIGLTDFVNQQFFSRIGVDLPHGYLDFFFGNTLGAIGEVSAVLLLLGSVYLLASRTAPWQIPASFFIAFAFMTRVFGGLPYGLGFGEGDVLFAVLSGGFLLTAFYFATDPASSPNTSLGMWVYGVGAGILAYLFRHFGLDTGGCAAALLVMNVCVPLINMLTAPRIFGMRRARGEPV